MTTVTIHDGIESYITDQCAVPVSDLREMTDAEIEEYFSAESFERMWGDVEAPYSFDALAAAAKDLRTRATAYAEA